MGGLVATVQPLRSARAWGRSTANQTRAASVALRRPSLRWLLIAYLCHVTARKGARVAVVIYAFDVGGIHAAAWAGVSMTLVAAFVVPIGSAASDLLHPRRSLALGYLLQTLGLLATAAAITRGAELWAVVVLASLLAGAQSLTRPVHLACLPDVARQPEELTLGNAATAWVDGLGSMVGPLLVGVLFSWHGAAAALVALAALSGVAALAVVRTPIHRIVEVPQMQLRQLLSDGARALARDRDAAGLVGVVASVYFVAGLLDVLGVAFVVQDLDHPSSSASLLAAAVGAGSAVGGAASMVSTARQRQASTIQWAAIVGGVALIALAACDQLWLAVGLVLVFGVSKALITIAGQTLLQRTIPTEVVGRVFGVLESVTQFGTALGAATGPWLVTHLGTRGPWVVVGAVLPVVAAIQTRRLRRLDAKAVFPGPLYDLLRAIPFLSNLPLLTVERLARSAQVRHADAGRLIICEGEPGDEYYVIQAGEAAVSIAGQRRRTLRPGDGFGEIALLMDTPRTATVTATSGLDLVCLDRATFLGAVAGGSARVEANRHAAQWMSDDFPRE
jgi:MFS family permease